MNVYTLADGRQIPAGVPFEMSGLAYQGNWLENASPDDLSAHSITSAQVVAPAASLEVIKADLIRTLHAQFEAACAKIITPGSAMASVYRVQVDAAYRMIAGAITTHPAIASLVPLLGATETDVATLIKTRNEACEAAMSLLNAKRLAAKAAIMAASDEPGARAAAVVDWGI